MSIFQVQEWWATTVGSSEEFHTNSVCIGNVDNALNHRNKVVAGSFEGKLRVYAPQQRAFKTEDLLIEKDLGMPILQIACEEDLINAKRDPEYGGEHETALLILHTRRLVIAQIRKEGFKTVHQHDFARNLFNFTVGKFGSRSPIICIQSVDGAIFFVQQDV
jgi:Bardet-Biedl syndrome 9 protein